MEEFDAKVRLNEEDGGNTGELDIMSPPPFDKGRFIGVTYGIIFNDPVFEATKKPDNWEYLKEHITEMRDADGELNQKQTCQFILNLMDVIEKGGDGE